MCAKVGVILSMCASRLIWVWSSPKAVEVSRLQQMPNSASGRVSPCQAMQLLLLMMVMGRRMNQLLEASLMPTGPYSLCMRFAEVIVHCIPC